MADLSELSLRIRRARSDLDQKLGERRALSALEERTSQEVDRLKTEIMELEKTSILLNSIGEEQQFKAQEAIESLVTEGLQTIFDDTLSFHILQKVNGKTPTVEFVIRTSLPNDRVYETSILDARGGGLAATVGFLLRLVVLLLRKDKGRKLLVLDETFAHVSDEYLPGLAEFLSQLSVKTGTQIIMVTHQDQFEDYANKVYRFSVKDGNTVVREVNRENQSTSIR